ncbi:type 2 lanthipeptide synthetase LanM family protein [Francisella sp. SYW-9]|uniref:type 2 lanthipeptide synthetase LanM family protein n=1 Tax=Francisella sp. SYW-9 TaxID=2610888 RepID=UPI00168D4207|nr:type 2 lanthipeptide synthetase LanM family protein [Francisella sp. SYW-9]
MEIKLREIISTNEELLFLNLLERQIEQTIAELINKSQYYSENVVSAELLLSLLKENLFRSLLNIITNVCALELASASREGYLKGETPKDRFYFFCEELKKKEHQEAIFEKYPKLKEKVSFVLTNFISANIEMLDRLNENLDGLQNKLFNDDTVKLIKVSASGDTHRLGRSTRILTFRSISDTTKEYKCVYKPRPSQIDCEFQSFFRWLSQESKIKFYTHKILDYKDYSWSEFVTYKSCDIQDDIKEYYQNLGAMLALVYVLSGCDLHLENIIAHGKYPVIIDYECFFTPSFYQIESEYMQTRTFVSDSLILPCRSFASDEHKGIDMSATNGEGGQEAPIASAYWENKGTDSMKIAKKRFTMKAADNIPNIKGERVSIINYQDEFKQGFVEIYRFFMENKELFLSDQSPLQFFKGLRVRVLTRSTSEYAQILNNTNHPMLLNSATEYEKYIDSNLYRNEYHCNYEQIIKHEKEELKYQDIPYFYTTTEGDTIYDGQNRVVNISLESSGFDRVKQLLNILSKEDLHIQYHIIEASFSSINLEDEVIKVSSYNDPKDYSSELVFLSKYFLSKIEALKIDNNGFIFWPTLKLYNQSSTPSFTELGLYDGLLGFMLLYAYAGEIIDSHYKKVAKQCLDSYLRSLSQSYIQSELSIDGYGSLGGGVFVLGQLYKLWKDPDLIKHIEKLLKIGQELIAEDNTFDIIGGSAGYITQLLTVSSLLKGSLIFEDSLDQCVNRILECYPNPSMLYEGYKFDGDQPIISYSHGTTGIALALACYDEHKCTQKVKQWIDQALEYEKSCFDENEKNWQDLRGESSGVKHGQSCGVSWCHGSVGIGLSRLKLAKILNQEYLLDDFSTSLDTTIDQMNNQNCRNLCHGLMGSSELLLQAYQNDYINEDTYKKYINGLLSKVIQNEYCDPQSYCAGIMLGEAGIVYQLLRLYKPNIVPSVLI